MNYNIYGDFGRFRWFRAIMSLEHIHVRLASIYQKMGRAVGGGGGGGGGRLAKRNTLCLIGSVGTSWNSRVLPMATAAWDENKGY